MADYGAPPARVLLIEDDLDAAMAVGAMLRAELPRGLLITHAGDVADAVHELVDHRIGCVLFGVHRRQAHPLGALAALINAAPETPVIVISEDRDDVVGLEAVKAGAQDYLLREELEPALLARAVRYAMERKRAQVELARQALHDPLTGLPNRTLFMDRLSVALDRSRRTGLPVTILFLDIDAFKHVNDTLGHVAGDALLTELAGRFQRMLRPMDTVARFGGDEFTFLFEGLSGAPEAVVIAQRISASAARPWDAYRAISTAVSIGIALVGDPDMAPEQAIQEADAAMYRAKQHGGATVELASLRVVQDRTPGDEAVPRLAPAPDAAQQSG